MARLAALLDTNILLAIVNANEHSPSLDGFDQVYVSTLTWAELTRGIYGAADVVTYRRRKRDFDRLVDEFGEGIPFGDECLAHYEQVIESLVSRGKLAGTNRIDRMIAATAITHSLAIVTRDKTGFAGLEGLVPILER